MPHSKTEPRPPVQAALAGHAPSICNGGAQPAICADPEQPAWPATCASAATDHVEQPEAPSRAWCDTLAQPSAAPRSLGSANKAIPATLEGSLTQAAPVHQEDAGASALSVPNTATIEPAGAHEPSDDLIWTHFTSSLEDDLPSSSPDNCSSSASIRQPSPIPTCSETGTTHKQDSFIPLDDDSSGVAEAAAGGSTDAAAGGEAAAELQAEVLAGTTTEGAAGGSEIEAVPSLHELLEKLSSVLSPLSLPSLQSRDAPLSAARQQPAADIRSQPPVGASVPDADDAQPVAVLQPGGAPVPSPSTKTGQGAFLLVSQQPVDAPPPRLPDKGQGGVACLLEPGDRPAPIGFADAAQTGKELCLEAGDTPPLTGFADAARAAEQLPVEPGDSPSVPALSDVAHEYSELTSDLEAMSAALEHLLAPSPASSAC